MSQLDKVRKYIKENNMIEKNDSVIVGLSGGADSVCLLDILTSLREELGLDITAVHVHHGIRGEEADRDLQFAKEKCEERNVKWIAVYHNIPLYAEKNGLSEEEAGRIIRYQEFERIREEMEGMYCKGENSKINTVKIAVAHNMNDSVETILHNLCRGSSLAGMAGIRPVNHHIIRPILCLTREEIERYLGARGIEYIQDSTNLSDEYTRNRIRNRLIPYLNTQINAQAARHIAETAGDISEAEAYINHQAKQMYKKVFSRHNNCIYADREKFNALDDIMKKRTVRMAIGSLAGKLKDITRKHIEDVISLSAKQSNKYIMLPYNITVKNEYNRMIFSNRVTVTRHEQEVAITASGIYQFGKYTFEVELMDVQNDKENVNFLEKYLKNEQKMYTKCFDYDKIINVALLRNRKSGDYLTVNNTGGTKKLKSYLIDEKIPAGERDNIPCLADGSHIMWVCGHRISEYYKITGSTTKIIKITVKNKDNI